jgi:hypothetical protein
VFAFALTTGVMVNSWNCSRAFGEELHHIEKATPTRSLMRLISTHTSKILDAILAGDFRGVMEESSAVAANSQSIIKIFFPEDGQPGDWYIPEGNNPEEEIKEMKAEFEKYLKIVIDSAENIAETAKNEDILETFKSLEAMLNNACFGCHGLARDKWPDWPDFMNAGGG